MSMNEIVPLTVAPIEVVSLWTGELVTVAPGDVCESRVADCRVRIVAAVGDLVRVMDLAGRDLDLHRRDNLYAF